MIAQAQAPLLQTSTSVPHPVWSTRLARPEHPVLMASGLTWTAKNLAEAVMRTAGRMHAEGVRAGEVVALCGPPSAEWVIALHALGWIGAVVAPLAPGAPVGEQSRCLDRAGASRVFLTHGLTASARDTVRAAAPLARFVTELPLGKAPPERFWPLDEPRVIVFTSGSGGESKPVHLSAAQILLSAFGSAIRLGHQPEDRWLACLPFHHVGGLSILFRCAFYGTTVVLHQRFRPRAVARALDHGDASLVSLVPTMLEQVLDARPEEPFPPSVRAILLGGDSAPERILERCRALNAPVALTWGMTEAASQITTRDVGDLGRAAGVGAPLAFARVEADADLGVLKVRGPLSAGEVETRDLGAVDPRGRVHVHGRAEEFIKSGGETIALREVEDALRGHPAVADVAVVGCADAHWGQRPAALLVAAGGVDEVEPPTSEALRAWCRERLSGFKVPDRFRWVEALPRTALGKLARAEAAALLEDAPPVTSDSGRTAIPAPRLQGSDADVEEPATARPTSSASAPPILTRLLGAAERYGASPFRDRLGEVQDCLSADLLAVEEELSNVAERLDRPPELSARNAARHLLALPGKRVRPLCVVLAARLGGRPLDAAVRNAAVACELIHAATLLHDDVIDEGTERRGAPAARVVFGNSASVLAGDFLFTDALSLVGQVGQPELLDRLLGVVSDMVEAEALQLERRGRLEPDRVSYLRILDGKTASLFRWGFWAGGVLGGLPAGACAALGRAGEALGVAFQLVDDVLDVAGDAATTGKDTLADLRQGKLTWPLIRAVEDDPSLTTELAALAAPVPPDDAEARLATLLERVRAMGTVEETQAFARAEGERALRELATLPAAWPRWMLEAIVEVVVDRSR